MSRVRKCVLCAGTGKIATMRSWFVDDGFLRSKCPICVGTGRSNHRPAREWIEAQRRFRVLALSAPSGTQDRTEP